MPKIHVERSILINSPVDEVYHVIRDFNHWTKWSPWLIMEPEATVKVAPDASYYEWEGNRVGIGNMRITNTHKNTSVDYDLVFLKPWKSKAKVRFELTSEKEGTRATWFMDSSLPIFMFWMKNMMEGFIGMDYQRGLRLLKDYAEDGEVHSKLEFIGEKEFTGSHYIGIKSTCAMDNLGPSMARDFGRLGQYCKDKSIVPSGHSFSIYHTWNMSKRMAAYTAALPVDSLPENLPGDFTSGQIPATKTYTLRHIGPYEHLGNAWSTLFNMQQAKSFKSNKKIDPFETYENSPEEVADNQLITDVHFPVE